MVRPVLPVASQGERDIFFLESGNDGLLFRSSKRIFICVGMRWKRNTKGKIMLGMKAACGHMTTAVGSEGSIMRVIEASKPCRACQEAATVSWLPALFTALAGYHGARKMFCRVLHDEGFVVDLKTADRAIVKILDPDPAGRFLIVGEILGAGDDAVIVPAK